MVWPACRRVDVEGGTMAGGRLGPRVVLCILMAASAVPALAQQNEFPLDSELFLDARPMPGSKRIPNMEVGANGAMILEMWCNRVEGQLVVAGDTMTVVLGQPTDRSCRPDQAQRDTDLLAALNAVTNWRRDGDDVIFVGAKTLRFKPATH
jgi:heat shock protein HslJ